MAGNNDKDKQIGVYTVIEKRPQHTDRNIE